MMLHTRYLKSLKAICDDDAPLLVDLDDFVISDISEDLDDIICLDCLALMILNNKLSDGEEI